MYFNNFYILDVANIIKKYYICNVKTKLFAIILNYNWNPIFVFVN